jgi:hypothetical protein
VLSVSLWLDVPVSSLLVDENGQPSLPRRSFRTRGSRVWLGSRSIRRGLATVIRRCDNDRDIPRTHQPELLPRYLLDVFVALIVLQRLAQPSIGRLKLVYAVLKRFRLLLQLVSLDCLPTDDGKHKHYPCRGQKREHAVQDGYETTARLSGLDVAAPGGTGRDRCGCMVQRTHHFQGVAPCSQSTQVTSTCRLRPILSEAKSQVNAQNAADAHCEAVRAGEGVRG